MKELSPIRIDGKATLQGTQEYSQRRGNTSASSHEFVEALGLYVPTVGLGTGRFTLTNEPSVVRQSAEVVRCALLGGINLVDCAPNYAQGSSEAIVGWILRNLIAEGMLERANVIIASKVGYPSVAGQHVHDKDLVHNPYLDEADLDHSLEPSFIELQLEESLNRLQLRTIDLYFLHNPEIQAIKHSAKVFENMICDALSMLERAVSEGKIGAYGIAAADGFSETHPGHHPLELLWELAERVGGRNHHFKAIQLPCNITRPNTFLDSGTGEARVKAVTARAKDLGLAVVASASLNGMHLPLDLLRLFLEEQPKLNGPAQAALQFTRSLPCIDCALVGTRMSAHIQSSLEVLSVPPATL